MPAHDGLLQAVVLCDKAISAGQSLMASDNPQLRSVVTEAARLASDLRPMLRGLVAQANAAQHPQAPERTFTDRFGRPCPPRPNLNAAHDHRAPPELPASSLA